MKPTKLEKLQKKHGLTTTVSVEKPNGEWTTPIAAEEFFEKAEKLIANEAKAKVIQTPPVPADELFENPHPATPKPPPPLRLEGVSEIIHINVRRELDGDRPTDVMIDVKIRFEQQSTDVLESFDPKLKQFLWKPNGNVSSYYLDPLRYICEVDSLTLSYPTSEKSFSNCTAKKFEIAPIDGPLAYITASVSFKPKPGDADFLSARLKDKCQSLISQAPSLF